MQPVTAFPIGSGFGLEVFVVGGAWNASQFAGAYIPGAERFVISHTATNVYLHSVVNDHYKIFAHFTVDSFLLHYAALRSKDSSRPLLVYPQLAVSGCDLFPEQASDERFASNPSC